jgi:hypothetical protein
VREGDVVVGRDLHDWRLGMCVEIDVGPQRRARVVYEWGPIAYDALHSQRPSKGAHNQPRVQVLGQRQRAIVNAAIAAEALRRMG